MIQFKDVSKQYGHTEFGVQEINLTIEEGEFVFLIGPSGSGKTTLIKMLIRDEKPSSGKIYFDDVDITHVSRQKVYLLRRQIGVIFQDFKLIPDKTAYENVAFAMEAAGKREHEIREKVPYLLDVVGLTQKLRAFPAQLSGGEQQRVAIARAMANNPRILIADEPTGNLDPGSAWDIVQILTKINSWGTTVIMSTHGTEIVNALSKRVIQMEHGAVVRDDAEGEYEFSSIPKEIQSESTETLPQKEKKQAIQVNLTEKMQHSEATETEETQGFFEKLAFWQDSHDQSADKQIEALHEKKLHDEQAAEFPSKSEELTMDAPETARPALSSPLLGLKKETSRIKKNKKQIDSDIQNVEIPVPLESAYKHAEQMEISYLNLPMNILNKLSLAGFETVAQIIDDGPAKLQEVLDCSDDELQFIAHSVEKALIAE